MQPFSHTVVASVARTSCFLALCSTCFAEPPEYSITDLGVLHGHSSEGWSVNESGQVAGVFDFEFLDEDEELSGASHAFLYSDGIMHDLGTLGREFSQGEDVNDSGVVVGTSDTADSQRAFLYSEGMMLDLGELSGNLSASTGHSINELGEVTGSVLTEEGVAAYVYVDGTMQPIPFPPEAEGCEALLFVGYAINNETQVTGEVGRRVAGGCHAEAFLYSHATQEMILIGDLLPNHSTVGYALNDNSEAVIFGLTTGDSGAYLYSDGQLTRIGGDRGLIAWDIDNRGRIVGQTGLGGEESRAFLYIDGEVHELDDLVVDLSGWEHLNNAKAISDSGYITGYGRVESGSVHGFLLTPLAVEVKIDVRPAHKQNKVNLRSNGIIGVAVLSAGTFDATQIDWETVRFGPGDAQEVHGRGQLRDVDRDGTVDFVAHFRIREAGIGCNDTDVSITGDTFDGRQFMGTDRIRIVQCR